MGYTKLPLTGGGSGGTTDDITNASSVTGATASDALETNKSSIADVEFITVTTQYVPQEPITLDATDITNKYVVLDAAPTDKEKTQAFVVGGNPQEYGADFEITADDGGKRFSWSGLGLESLLTIGDKLVIVYN